MTPKKSLSDISILIAEDNLVNQLLMRKVIEKVGMKVDVAANGLQVLEKLNLSDNNFDVILMDFQMPEMDGLEATEKIIQTYGENRPLIFGITAGSFEDDDTKFRSSGMDAKLNKPFKASELIDLLTEKGI